MKIKMSPSTPNRIRPATPTVVLTDEAYDKLLSLSCEFNVSMRQLASAIIVQAAEEGVEFEEKEVKENDQRSCGKAAKNHS